MNTNNSSDLLNSKLELLQEIYGTLKCQYENIKSDNLDLLEENINKVQLIMLQIDKIDSNLAESLDIDNTTKNSDIMVLIKNILSNIKIQDTINMAEGNAKYHEYSDLLKQVNIQKSVIAYENMFQQNSSYFIDKKE